MYKLLKINLARNSLRYIIRNYKITEIYIPYYLCDVIRHNIIKENCKPTFYHINDNFMPADELPQNAYILYPNYFGICDKNVDILAKKYKYLIVDNAHSFYSKPKGFACFNSARKFLPVYYGSYLWIKNINYIPDIEIIKKKTDNIELKENCFSSSEIKSISQELCKEIEQYNLINIRKKSFENLHKLYGKTNLLKIESALSPFCYPYLAKDEQEADLMAEKLQEQGYEIYRYWNQLPKSYSEYKFYKNLVAIPLEL